MMLRKPPKVFIAALLGCVCASALANGKQISIRAGMLKGSYSGPVSASFATIPSIDVEMELFQNARTSALIKANLSVDVSKAKMFYSSVGAGQRYYLRSPGMNYDRQEGSFSIDAGAANRYFVGWDLSVAQVLIQEFTASYSVVGSVVELGGTAGIIHQISKTLGLSAALGAGYGMGFTTVSVNGLSLRFNIGVTSSF